MGNLRREFSDKFLSTFSADELKVVENCYAGLEGNEGAGQQWYALISIMHEVANLIYEDDLYLDMADEQGVDVKEFDADRRSLIPLFHKLFDGLREDLDVYKKRVDAWEATQ